jgi:hypothetical protein
MEDDRRLSGYICEQYRLGQLDRTSVVSGSAHGRIFFLRKLIFIVQEIHG